jgi:hypothetical protein
VLFANTDNAKVRVKIPLTLNDSLGLVKTQVGLSFGVTYFNYKDNSMEEFFSFKMMNMLKKFLRGFVQQQEAKE